MTNQITFDGHHDDNKPHSVGQTLHSEEQRYCDSHAVSEGTTSISTPKGLTDPSAQVDKRTTECADCCEGLSISWNPVERYEVVSNLGHGQYSNVFLAYDTMMDRMVVAKVLNPVKKEAVLQEYAMLKRVKGGPNVIELLDTAQNPSTCWPIFVFEYVESVDFRVILPHLTDLDIRYYLYQLLRALEYAHSLQVMHRDIKPSNICIDYRKRVLRVIDWGMADIFHPETTHRCNVGSRYFKAPELLVDLSHYDCRLDMWSFGCIFAGLIFKMDPFFCGMNHQDQLLRIIHVLGEAEWRSYARKYHIKPEAVLSQATSGCSKKEWSRFIHYGNRDFCSPEALDLLGMVLQLDYVNRMHAKEALAHKYFDPIRSSFSDPIPSISEGLERLQEKTDVHAQQETKIEATIERGVS